MQTVPCVNEWCRHLSGIDYVVTSPFTWETGPSGFGGLVEIPEGFIFNCSVPPKLRWLVNPHNPQYRRASAVHDILLIKGVSRVRAGAEFEAVLREDKVKRLARAAMWIAVSLYKYE